MIIAASHRKLKRQIDLYEDEVTSCIWGEIQRLPVADVWEIFKYFSTITKLSSHRWPSDEPDNCNFEFWPKFGAVEPDLIVRFYKNQQPILQIIVEIKWNAKLSPKCELIRQWINRPEKDEEWLHFYLVKNVSEGSEEIARSLEIAGNGCSDGRFSCCGPNKHQKIELSKTNFSIPIWADSLKCIGWRDVVSAISECKSDVCKELATGIRVFFEKQKIVLFSGFFWLHNEKISSENTEFFPKKYFYSS